MTDSTQNFISELIRAANETPKLTRNETVRLLQRAAATIRDYREQIAYSDSPANDLGEGDIVFELNVMAASIELFPPEKVSAMLLEAAEAIKACRVLLEEKRGIGTGNERQCRGNRAAGWLIGRASAVSPASVSRLCPPLCAKTVD